MIITLFALQSDHKHQQCLPIEIVEVEACPDGEELRHATVVGSVRHPTAAAPTPLLQLLSHKTMLIKRLW